MKKLVLAALWLAVSGCDLFSDQETYDVRGRVVNAETGLPIEGVFVSLGHPNFGVTVLAWDETSENGTFRIRYKESKNTGLIFEVNGYSISHEDEYDKCYSSFMSLDIKNEFDVELDYRC